MGEPGLGDWPPMPATCQQHLLYARLLWEGPISGDTGLDCLDLARSGAEKEDPENKKP